MSAPPAIERGRTALRRTALSSPMRRLLDLGFFDGTRTVLDYGCGHGDDVDCLNEMGVEATGWDPVFRPDGERRAADVVNLGFVLNVIEDAGERRETLRAAFALARDVLAVSVMLEAAGRGNECATCGDGVRTQRNTFQKYYSQNEFRNYLEETLDANAVPIATGVCLVFRKPTDEQLFLLARQQVRREWRLLRREPGPEAVVGRMGSDRALLDSYWRTALELGRPPAVDECTDGAALVQLAGSWRRVHGYASRFFGGDELQKAEASRREDLLVYFALSMFGRRKPYGALPARLQRDVRFFFGSITKARAAGRDALFAVGAGIEDSAVACHEELGIGRLSGRHDLVFHRSFLERCVPAIRIYVGCALQLFGDVESVDLIKVHLQSSKVTFLLYDDFASSPQPRLVERIKVDLPALSVSVFDHTSDQRPQYLEAPAAAYGQRNVPAQDHR